MPRRAPARARPARPRRPLQAQLRPAPGHARRPRPRPRRDRRDDGRRPPEPAGGHPAARRGGRGGPTSPAAAAPRATTPGAARSRSRLINGMLRRFTGVAISDFGCAFNAYRRTRRRARCSARSASRSSRRRSILSGGASVVEVDVGHAAAPGSSRYSPLRLTRLALHVLAGFWPQPIQWIGIALGARLHAARDRPRRLRDLVLDRPRRLPRPAARRRRRALRPRDPGLHPRARRRVSGQNPARGRGPAAVLDREGALVSESACWSPAAPGSSRRTSSATCWRTRRYEVVSLDALTYAGNLENLADVMGHERLSFVHGDIRDADLVAKVVAEVDVIVNAAAESHVEKSIEEGASEFVTTNVEGTQILLDAIRARRSSASSSSRRARSTARPSTRRWTRSTRSTRAGRTRRRRPAATGSRTRYFVTYGLPIVIVRPFNNYGPRQHPEKVDPALHHAGAGGRAADDPRRRPREPRLALRRRRRRGDRGDHRGRPRRARGRGRERRDRRRHLRRARSPTLVLAARRARRRRRCTSRSGPARSTGTSARPRRSSGSPAGARGRASRTGSSGRSPGTARTRPGGGRSSAATRVSSS